MPMVARRIWRSVTAACLGSLLILVGTALGHSSPASATKVAALTGEASYDVDVLVASRKGPITVEGKYLAKQSTCTTGSNWSADIPKLVEKPGGSIRPEDKYLAQYMAVNVGHFKVLTSGFCFIKPAIARYQIFLKGKPSHALLEVGQLAVRSFTTRCTDTASFQTLCATRLGPRVELIINPK